MKYGPRTILKRVRCNVARCNVARCNVVRCNIARSNIARSNIWHKLPTKQFIVQEQDCRKDLLCDTLANKLEHLQTKAENEAFRAVIPLKRTTNKR